MIALFPNTPNSKKNAKGSEALNKNNLVCKALRLIKKNYKEAVKWYRLSAEQGNAQSQCNLGVMCELLSSDRMCRPGLWRP